MNIKRDGIAPNAPRLLWAGFVAILATGVGFGVRGGILANWGAEFGFTGVELGAITDRRVIARRGVPQIKG